MKSFMQMLLASFGVLSLVLAGCSTTDDAVVEGDDTVVDEEVAVPDTVDETAEDAE
ncbi:MAG: hypothetical protein WC924_04620 [Candidatus Gracilibacteria bacterium]